MSTELTPDMLRDLSVSVVEGFLNNRVPLSQGIAKQAAQLDLNPEQIQRAVETVNTITYLKGLQMTEDRTFEFPLAKHAEVMAAIALPDKEAMNMAGAMCGDEHSANAYSLDGPETKPALGQGDSPNEYPEDDVQTAPEMAVDPYEQEMALREKVAIMRKEAAINDGRIARLKERELTIVPELLKTAKAVSSDPQFIEKLAFVAPEQEYNAVCALVKNEVIQAPDYAKDLLFKEAEVKTVRKLAELYKEANELRLELEHRMEFQKKAGELEKSAGLVTTIGRVIGGAISAPVKMVGNGAKALANRAKVVGSTAAMNTADRFESAMTGKPLAPRATPPASAAFKRGVAATGLAASAGLDATMYTPGGNATGTSGDVWDALQG